MHPRVLVLAAPRGAVVAAAVALPGRRRRVAGAVRQQALPGPKTGVFDSLSALHAHTNAPYKTDLHRETLMALNRPPAARTEELSPLQIEQKSQRIPERGTPSHPARPPGRYNPQG
jgi:hypothetical protein